jgi:hypothetical protein
LLKHYERNWYSQWLSHSIPGHEGNPTQNYMFKNIHRNRHRNVEWNELLLSSWWNCAFEFLSILWYLNHPIFVGFFAHESEVQCACGSVLHKALTLNFQHISLCIVIKSRL